MRFSHAPSGRWTSGVRVHKTWIAVGCNLARSLQYPTHGCRTSSPASLPVTLFPIGFSPAPPGAGFFVRIDFELPSPSGGGAGGEGGVRLRVRSSDLIYTFPVPEWECLTPLR